MSLKEPLKSMQMDPEEEILKIIDDLNCDDTLVNRVHIDNYIKGNYGPKRLHELVHSTHVQRF
jgi:hypothetical protein